MSSIQPTPSKPKKKLTAPEFVLINRNFLHYPLVLSHFATPRFRLRRKLEGDPRLVCLRHKSTRIDQGSVSLYLPYPQYRHNTARAPSRFDMDMVFRLLRLAFMERARRAHKKALKEGRQAIRRVHQKRQARRRFFKNMRDGISGDPEDAPELDRTEREAGQSTYEWIYKSACRDPKILENMVLTFPSLYALTKALGRVPKKAANHRAVRKSGEYLADLRVGYFATWSERKYPHKRAKLRHKEFGFLEKFEVRANGSVLVKLDPEFVRSALRYTAKIRLPFVTTSEAAQALDGLVRVWRPSKLSEGIKRNFQTLANRLGVVANSRVSLTGALDRVVNQVNCHRYENAKQGPRITIKPIDRYGHKISIVARRNPKAEQHRVQRTGEAELDDSHVA